jgi:hypothetical protein
MRGTGAGDSVAVELARLRDLAATARSLHRRLSRRRVRLPRCRVDGATVGGRPVHPRPGSATECDHGRHPVACSLCRTGRIGRRYSGGGQQPHRAPRPVGELARNGIAALDAALADMGRALANGGDGRDRAGGRGAAA